MLLIFFISKKLVCYFLDILSRYHDYENPDNHLHRCKNVWSIFPERFPKRETIQLIVTSRTLRHLVSVTAIFLSILHRTVHTLSFGAYMGVTRYDMNLHIAKIVLNCQRSSKNHCDHLGHKITSFNRHRANPSVKDTTKRINCV